MAIVTQFQDADEYFHDTDAEMLANAGLYGVVEGCAVTYDAADLTIDIAAGTILHNGSVVTVAAAANALTLVADGSNERWSYITLDSSGSAVLVSGDPAADASTEPTKPELGDRVMLAAVKIEAAQGVANDIAVKLDKRLMVAQSGKTVGVDTTERTTTSLTTVDLATITTNIPATSWFTVRGLVRKTAGAAASVQLGLKLNSTQVIPDTAVTGAADEAEHGWFRITVPPRVTNYLRAALIESWTFEGTAGPDLAVETMATADAPTATITSVIITGLTGNASVTLAVDEIQVIETTS